MAKHLQYTEGIGVFYGVSGAELHAQNVPKSEINPRTIMHNLKTKSLC